MMTCILKLYHMDGWDCLVLINLHGKSWTNRHKRSIWISRKMYNCTMYILNVDSVCNDELIVITNQIQVSFENFLFKQTGISCQRKRNWCVSLRCDETAVNSPNFIKLVEFSLFMPGQEHWHRAVAWGPCRPWIWKFNQ